MSEPGPILPISFGYSNILQNALQLGNNPECFKRLRINLRSIGEKYLRRTSTYLQQKGAIKSIEDSLKEMYPDFFAGDDNKRLLGYAMIYIRQYHDRQHIKCRKSIKSKTPAHRMSVEIKVEKAPQSEKENELRDTGEMTETPLCSQKTPLLERMAQNLALYSNSDKPSSPMNVLTPKSQPRPGIAPTLSPASVSAPPLCQSSFLASQPSSQVLSPPPPCAQGVHRSSCQSPLSPDMAASSSSQSFAVHRFLTSCVPSMGHLLDRFISFGCSSEEFLLGVSMWSRAEIEHFLDQLPVKDDEKPLSPMEKLVLLNRFLSYFA